MKTWPFVVGVLTGVVLMVSYQLKRSYKLPYSESSEDLTNLVPTSRQETTSGLKSIIQRGDYSPSDLKQLVDGLVVLQPARMAELMNEARFVHEQNLLWRTVINALVDEDINKALKVVRFAPNKVEPDRLLISAVTEKNDLDLLSSLIAQPLARGALAVGLAHFLNDGRDDDVANVFRRLVETKGPLTEFDRQAFMEALPADSVRRFGVLKPLLEPENWEKIVLNDIAMISGKAGEDVEEVLAKVSNGNGAMVAESMVSLHSESRESRSDDAKGNSSPVMSRAQHATYIHRRAIGAFVSMEAMEALDWAVSLEDSNESQTSFDIILSQHLVEHPIRQKQFLDSLDDYTRENPSSAMLTQIADWIQALKHTDATMFEQLSAQLKDTPIIVSTAGSISADRDLTPNTRSRSEICTAENKARQIAITVGGSAGAAAGAAGGAKGGAFVGGGVTNLDGVELIDVELTKGMDSCCGDRIEAVVWCEYWPTIGFWVSSRVLVVRDRGTPFVVGAYVYRPDPDEIANVVDFWSGKPFCAPGYKDGGRRRMGRSV